MKFKLTAQENIIHPMTGMVLACEGDELTKSQVAEFNAAGIVFMNVRIEILN